RAPMKTGPASDRRVAGWTGSAWRSQAGPGVLASRPSLLAQATGVASGDLLLDRVGAAEELLVLGGALEGRGRRFALDGLGDRIEVAGADLALMLDRGEALRRRGELRFLQLDEGAHL